MHVLSSIGQYAISFEPKLALLLQKQRDQDGGETLSELDKLYVVHVIQHKRERWDAGGPILPRLSTALEKYPHTIIELEVSIDKHNVIRHPDAKMNAYLQS